MFVGVIINFKYLLEMVILFIVVDCFVKLFIKFLRIIWLLIIILFLLIRFSMVVILLFVMVVLLLIWIILIVNIKFCLLLDIEGIDINVKFVWNILDGLVWL